MKIVVTHTSPDLDAITSVWLIHKFLVGWEHAAVEFVPAGERKNPLESKELALMTDPIERVGDDEIIHVDTGLGPLDHHQTQDDTVCGASRTWDYVSSFIQGGEKWEEKKEAVSRMVKVVVAIDHFKEVFWPDASADYHEFSLFGVLEGLKLQKPNQDMVYVDFIKECLDATLHNFENRIWAEREIKENGKVFETKFGKGMGFESLNDTVLKLAQKMGYTIVVRKDPRKGYVRIKARPAEEGKNIDLTPVYEKLSEMDPEATWFLHVSKKMLLNGTTKNPKMKASKLSLDEIVKVLEEI
ncbi:MAG: hypothetical protein KBD46_02905 [Candidatus Levybacteria bacterium]|nr:hypothetical protein [Candidatus Levybacteria bacterium]